MYSVSQYATLTGTTRQNILKKCERGTIKAQKVGNTWVIQQEPPTKERTE